MPHLQRASALFEFFDLTALQSGNGLKRCRDATELGFERYVALGILGRNLHTLGKLVIAQEDASAKAAYSKRLAA